jgi:hypothetical protein
VTVRTAKTPPATSASAAKIEIMTGAPAAATNIAASAIAMSIQNAIVDLLPYRRQPMTHLHP